MTVSSVCLSRFFALPLEEDDAGPTRRAPSWALSEIRDPPAKGDDTGGVLHVSHTCFETTPFFGVWIRQTVKPKTTFRTYSM